MDIKKNIAISDSGFLFNPSTGDSYSMNQTGKTILELLKGGQSDTEIVEHITQHYMIDKDSVEKDLYDFKNMLENYKLASHE